MNKITRFIWAAFALVIALVVAYPMLAAIAKTAAMVGVALVVITVVVLIIRAIVGGRRGRLMR